MFIVLGVASITGKKCVTLKKLIGLTGCGFNDGRGVVIADMIRIIMHLTGI